MVGMAVAVVPSYLPSVNHEKTTLITDYFKQGFKYSEILSFLLVKHGILMSLRQLKRILKRLNLKRRGLNLCTPIENVIDMVQMEIVASGHSVGYRTVWRRLKINHNLHVRRDDVMNIMKALDPDGVEMRKSHRLKRRFYCAKGPNYIWHLDGYDKLKPFGFCIHGAIDGFSRKVIWLEVSDSNNNPRLIARYYLDALKAFGKAPRILRCDAGTENTLVCLLQQVFRNEATDSFAGIRSVIVGRSTSNQRIERFWCSLRQQGIQRWIDFFKDLRDSGRFNELDPVHCENLKFCFMPLIQAHLDRIAQQWNVHDIRPQRTYELHYGKPDCMYFLPEMYNTCDVGTVTDARDIKCCKDMYSIPKRRFDEFNELAQLLKPNLEIPMSADDGLQLFYELNDAISRIEND